MTSSTSPLVRLYEEFGQSPWYDNLTRELILDGGLAALVADGIRGVTSNPTIFDKAMAQGDRYDEQMLACAREPDIVCELGLWRLSDLRLLRSWPIEIDPARREQPPED